MLKIFVSVFFIGAVVSVSAQNPLPDFSVKKGIQNHAVVSWRNNYGNLINLLNIQRSNDSARGFRTIYSSPNATLELNAYTDNRPLPGQDYYRIFYTLKDGSYFFTKAKRITPGFVSEDLLGKLDTSVNIHVEGDVSEIIPFKTIHQFADSVLISTSDSLFLVNDSTVRYRKLSNVPVAVIPNRPFSAPSKTNSNYLFSNADGNVVIRLPIDKLSDFSMIIYQPDFHKVMYKIDRFDSPELILSKSSFFRAGWYPYELYEDGKLKEKNQFELK